MSFSKAKIHRFNEATSEVPPPGAYDPIFDNKVKGSVAIGEKPGRFPDSKSSASSGTDWTSVSSRGTVPPVKPFRTPQVPKRRVVSKPTGMSCPRSKAKLFKEEKQPQAQYEPQQELADVKVELTNKDRTIHEYEKILEEMKEDMRTLNEKYLDLQREHSEFEETHHKKMESMAKVHQEVEEYFEVKQQAAIDAVRSELLAAMKEKEEQILEKNDVISQLKTKVRELQLKLETCADDFVLVEEMANLDVSTEQLTENVKEKEARLDELKTLQADAEKKLEAVQTQLQQAEEKMADFEMKFKNLGYDSLDEVPVLNKQVSEDITAVLREYINHDNWARIWNYNEIEFHPEVGCLLEEIKKVADEWTSTYERNRELMCEQYNELCKQKIALERDLETKLQEATNDNRLMSEQIQELLEYRDQAKERMDEYKDELEKANIRLEDVINEYETKLEEDRKESEERLAKYKDELEKANNGLDQAIREFEAHLEEDRKTYLAEEVYFRQSLDQAKADYALRINGVKEEYEARIEKIQQLADKRVQNAEDVTMQTMQACRAESEEKIMSIIHERTKLIDSAVNMAKRETEKHLQRLEVLENEKAALNSTLSQKDIEIERLTVALEEMRRTAETQESFSQSLQAELDRAEAELSEKKDEVRNLKDELRSESAEMVTRRRRFSLAMAEYQASVEALTDKIAQMQSEQDQLQRELSNKDACLVSVSESATLLKQQLDSITSSVDQNLDYLAQIESSNINQINQAKSAFHSQIDQLASSSMQQLVITQQQNKQLKANLREMSDRLNDATNMLLKLEQINDEQSLKASKLQLNLTKLQEQLNTKEQKIQHMSLRFQTHAQKYESDMSKMNEQLSRMEQEKKQVEVERDRLKARLRQVNAQQLEGDRHDEASKKDSEVGDNLPKKWKTVLDLNNTINLQQSELHRLRQELDSNNGLVQHLRQVIAKLRLERRHAEEEKENFFTTRLLQTPSPHKQLFPKSTNTTPVASPGLAIPHAPLRDRND